MEFLVPVLMEICWAFSFVFCVIPAVGFGILLVVIALMIHRERQQKARETAVAAAARGRADPASALRLGDCLLPVEDAFQHVLILGSPGSGKTVLLSSILSQLLERQAKVLVYDVKGYYIERFYDPHRGDIIFNPLDARSVGWTLTRSVRMATDAHALAEALIPDRPEGRTLDPYWPAAARDVFAQALLFVARADGGNADLVALLRDYDALAEALRGTEAYYHLAGELDKQSKGVLGLLSAQARALPYLRDSDWTPADWLASDGPGVVFVANTPRHAEALRPLLSVFVNALALDVLSRPDGAGPDVWMILDEVATLHVSEAVIRLITQVRSKRASIWLASQGLNVLADSFGRERALAVVGSTGTVVAFRLGETDAVRWVVARAGGEIEVSRWQASYSAPVSFSPGRPVIPYAGGHQTVQRSYILWDHQVQTLPPLQAWFIRPDRFTGVLEHPYPKVILRPQDLPVVAPAFVPRDDLRVT
jgi:type IV secretory pathway TraG/TraD family ATPase VirD4